MLLGLCAGVFVLACALLLVYVLGCRIGCDARGWFAWCLSAGCALDLLLVCRLFTVGFVCILVTFGVSAGYLLLLGVCGCFVIACGLL